MGKFANYLVGIAVALIVGSAILPTAISNFFSSNTTGWSTDATTLWAIIPLMVIVAIVVKVYSDRR